MRGFLTGLALFAVLFAATAEDHPFRIFTSADGQVIEARIVDYNASRNQLRIARRNGQTIVRCEPASPK
ncbi:hypothetical protein [Pontiella sp.]|uniref:hypothetical protein n=1 Tax=Pontiella sp. TaxID=2837462 RepID=UPI003568053E